MSTKAYLGDNLSSASSKVFYTPTLIAYLVSPMLKDPDPSQRHAALKLQQEVTMLKARFKPTLSEKSGADRGLIRRQPAAKFAHL